MIQLFINTIISIWQILGEMSVYLLFGFFMAGLLHVIIPQSFIEKHLSGKGLGTSVKASLIGVPMPLCSCGVIPVTASLRKHGAGKGATISFLTSTPQTGIDSIMITYGLLGWLFAVFRIITAFISGIFCGTAVEFFDPDTDDPKYNQPVKSLGLSKKASEIFRYGFISLPRDIGKSLILGLILAGLISVLIPKSFFTAYLDNTFISMFVMMLIGLPLYVCSTASVPVAATFLNMGLNPGAVLVFLITGPATNAATITTISKILSRKSAVIYLITIALSAFIAGMIFNAVIPADYFLLNHLQKHFMIPEWFNNISAIILLIILSNSLIQSKKNLKCNHSVIESHVDEKTVIFKVEGMNCSHCAEAVKTAVNESCEIISVDINLSEGTVLVNSNNIDIDSIIKNISALGYKITINKN